MWGGRRETNGGDAATPPTLDRRTLVRLPTAAGLAVLAGCSSVLGSGKRDRLVDHYRRGIEAYNAGVEAHNDGVVAYRSDENERAIDRLETATARLESALDAFRDANAIASDIENDQARRLCSRAVDASRRLAEASDLLARSARAFLENEPERAQQFYDEYRALGATDAAPPTTERVAEVVEGPLGL